MKKLGSRIRRKRENAHLQLNDLAKKVGISSSALSQIENAKAFPSIVTLKSIADSLHTSVGELIGENESLMENPFCSVEQNAFIKENESGTKLYLLSQLDPMKRMETYKVLFTEGSNADDIMSCHNGQEFIYLLNGDLKIQQNERIYILKPGDTFFMNSTQDCRVISGSSAEAIWVVVPD